MFEDFAQVANIVSTAHVERASTGLEKKNKAKYVAWAEVFMLAAALFTVSMIVVLICIVLSVLLTKLCEGWKSLLFQWACPARFSASMRCDVNPTSRDPDASPLQRQQPLPFPTTAHLTRKMGYRDRLISTSILRAIFRAGPAPNDEEAQPGLIARIIAFFAIFSLTLSRYRARLFEKLRNKTWEIEEEEYKESFRSPSKSKRTDLVPVGDLGYSGSTFFTTPNSKYLVKSLPRAFEQSFFRDRLLGPYVEHMELNENSLLVRITDLLYTPTPTLGAAIGAAPSHHIIMENILFGKSACAKHHQGQWETYDLKPNDYFYPERDVAGGRLAPESVKERLIDEFPDKVRVTIDQKEELVAQLSRDSKILQDANAVDYSLFLVRYPADLEHVPTPPGRGSSWRNGVASRDQKWIYRAIILDFFWAKDSSQAQTLTGLVKLFNALKFGKDHGPMSITTTSDEYRQRFLGMVNDMIEVPDSAGRPSGEVRTATPSSRGSEEV